jgi:hypothetical protein
MLIEAASKLKHALAAFDNAEASAGMRRASGENWCSMSGQLSEAASPVNTVGGHCADFLVSLVPVHNGIFQDDWLQDAMKAWEKDQRETAARTEARRKQRAEAPAATLTSLPRFYVSGYGSSARLVSDGRFRQSRGEIRLARIAFIGAAHRGRWQVNESSRCF